MKTIVVSGVLVFFSVASIYSGLEMVFFPALVLMCALMFYQRRLAGFCTLNCFYLIFSVYVIYSILWTYNSGDGVKASFYVFFLYLTVFFLVALIAGRLLNIKVFLWFCILGFLVVNVRNILSPAEEIYRLGGVAGQPNTLGLISSAGAILSFFYFSLFSRQCSRIEKVILVCTFTLSIYFLVRSGSRGAFISLVVPIILYSLRFKYLLRPRHLVFILSAVVLAAAFIIKFSDAPLLSRLLLLPNALGIDLATGASVGQDYKNSADSSRVWIAELALTKFMDRPILGHGVGSFGYMSEFSYTHNAYLEMIFTLGIVGMLLFYGPLVYMFLYSFSSRVVATDKDMAVALRCLIVYFILAGLSIPNYQNKTQIYILVLIVSLYAALTLRRKSEGSFLKPVSALNDK